MGLQYSKRPVISGGNLVISGAGAPKSGSTAGTGLKDRAPKGSLYRDTTYGTLWVNEGTGAAPYWSPLSPLQTALWGVVDDFRHQFATAISDTTANLIIPGSGLRIFGQGVTETDSGAIVNAAGEGGHTLRMTTTDEVAHLVAIGTQAGVYQPDQHGMAVLDVEFTNVSAITLRGVGVGFVGTAADALDPPITAATTVATLVQDDLALIHQNVGYTDVDRLYVAHNKSDAAASMTVVDSGVNLAAAGTFQRVRVEIDADGGGRFFVDKALVATVAAMVDADEELSPVLYLESTSTAVKSLDVRRFTFIAHRP